MSEGSWLVQIRSAPCGLSGRELLELVLAGASLEIALDVVFGGEGLQYLSGNEFVAWRQLLDYDLAGLWYLADPESMVCPPSGVRALNQDEFQRMRARAAGVLQL